MEPLCDHYTYVRWHRWFGGTWTFGQFIWSTFLLIYPFQKIKFWKSTSAGVWDCDILNMTSFWNFGNASSDNLTSVKWNRHCAQLVEEPFLGKFPARRVYLPRGETLLENVWRGGIPFLLSTIYYPPDQLYGPHCWPWEGGKTQHLPSFLEMEKE